MIIELLSRRAEMLVFEFDEVLFALKYNRPALVPLFQLPPTYRTRQPDEEFTPNAQRRSATRRQSLFRLNYTLQNAGGCDPRTPGGDCEATPRTGDARRCSSPNPKRRRSHGSTTDPHTSRCSSSHQRTRRASQMRNKRSPGRMLFPSRQTFSE